ncbi:carboxymuconolactone decarboxylase family protein [Cupriavidus sp. BIC8F]|uniref:carboxymuconolactone decarboxylase family protein n=1 Tax=Cupriavidus sp. BIC8F TaxID=3079014 RepID=UPI002916E36F|nr:carboxymuconolactone decarboxylase family protein [Cupriavidus sp. BIC8F]
MAAIESVKDITSRIEGPASNYVQAFEAHRSNLDSAGNAQGVLTPRQRALVRLAIAVAMPCKEMLRTSRSEAEGIVAREEIEQAVSVATALRAGAAVAYGRLAYKYLNGEADGTAVSSAVSEIKKDRELMTQFRKSSPADFERMTMMLGEMHKDGLPLSKLDYELLAIGCATITQCVYCMEHHINAARALGIQPSQVAQVVHLAVSARVEASFFAAEEIL